MDVGYFEKTYVDIGYFEIDVGCVFNYLCVS
jgi:hypothetical protein